MVLGLRVPRPPLVGGPIDEPDPPFTLVDVTPSVPAIAAQPTEQGRRIRLGPPTPDGSVLLAYGDANANTGPIDVVGFHPDTGVVTTYLSGFDTERIDRYRVLDDGWIWAASDDPRGGNPASLVTNAPSGTWRTLTVGVPGRPVATHLYDLAQVAGPLYVCGNRDLTTPEGGAGANGGNSATAIVWRSGDGGSTWAEDLAVTSLTLGSFAFRALTITDDVLHAQGTNGYRTRSSGWGSDVDGLAPPEVVAPEVAEVLDVLGAAWTGTLSAGVVYVCDGTTIYRVET